MINYIAFDQATGEIIRTGTAQHENHVSGHGFLLLENINNITPLTHYVDIKTKEIIKKPLKPSNYFEWDQKEKKWILNLILAKQAAVLRRNELLSTSDWTQLPDVPLATKQAWASYRQALRDITDQLGFPLHIQWPLKPSN